MALWLKKPVVLQGWAEPPRRKRNCALSLSAWTDSGRSQVSKGVEAYTTSVRDAQENFGTRELVVNFPFKAFY